MKRQQTSQALLWGMALALILGGAGHLIGQTILIDDFNDGNDDGWTHLDNTIAEPYGPATYDASSGVYHLDGAGPVPVRQIGAFGSIWDDSIAPQFSNGFLRARVRANTEGTSAVLGLRRKDTPDAADLYLIGLSTEGNYFFILKQFASGGNVMLNTLPDPQIAAGQDWMLEAGAVGDQLTLKVWRPGDPEPATPQLIATDTELTSGGFGVAAYISGNYLAEATVSATFDDIYFTLVPEPSTLMSLALGLLVLVGCAQRR